MRLVERMPCLYHTEHDLIQRISGTICRYKDLPYLVEVDKTVVQLRSLDKHQLVHSVFPDDPDLDLSSPEIGYFNLVLPEAKPKHRVMYASRHPRRQYRQGLCSSNLSYKTLEGQNTGDFGLYIPGFPEASWIHYPGFIGMLENDYPSLDDAFETLEKGVFEAEIQNPKSLIFDKKEIAMKEMAISKDCALQRTESGVYQVWYKTTNVGWTTPETRKVSVPSSEMGWIISKFLSDFSWKVE